MTTRRENIARDLALAGLLIGLSLLAALARPLGLVENPDTGLRLVNIFIGLVLARYGNVVPRQLVRYEPDSDRPARRQACLRFCGWAFALGGLGYAAIWALLPIDLAAFWSLFPVGGALLLVGLRIGLARRGRQ